MSLQAEQHCPTCTCTTHAKKNPVNPFPIDYGFDQFWEVYPRRSGLPKGHKAKSLARWETLALEDRRLAYRAALVLAQLVEAGMTLPKDSQRFLALGPEYWLDLATTSVKPPVAVVRVVA